MAARPPLRPLASLLVAGIAGATTPSTASADVPSFTTVRHSWLATEALTLSEDIELELDRRIEPSSVTPREERRVLRGRLLLATGVPLLVWGSILTGLARPARDDVCHERNDRPRFTTASGLSMVSLGGGLSIGGIVALVRTSKAARAAPKSRKARLGLTGAAFGSIVASTVIFGFGFADFVVNCLSS